MNETRGISFKKPTPAMTATGGFCCKSALRYAANRDSVLLTRIVARASHDGPAEERAQLAYQFVQMCFLVDMPLTGVRPHERYFLQLMAFGGALHALTPRMRRNVEPRHVKRHQAEPVMVQLVTRRAGAPMSIRRKSFTASCTPIGISSPTLVAVGPISKIAQWQNVPPGRIGFIDNQSEAFRASGRATPDERWRHVLAFARIDFWYTAIGWKGDSL